MNVGGVFIDTTKALKMSSLLGHMSLVHLNTVHITIHNLQATSLLTKMSKYFWQGNNSPALMNFNRKCIGKIESLFQGKALER